MPTIPAIFPTCQAPDVDYESIRSVQKHEDRLNSEAEEACKKLNAGCGYNQIHIPDKHILMPWKFK